MEPKKQRFWQAASMLPPPLAERLALLPQEIQDKAREIRLRAEKPLQLSLRDGEVFLTAGGKTSPTPGAATAGSNTGSSNNTNNSVPQLVSGV